MIPAASEGLGLCLGASSIGLVVLRRGDSRPSVRTAHSRAHGGDPAGTLDQLLSSVPQWATLPVGVTGRKLRNLVRLPSISEPEAVELAARFVANIGGREVNILSAGGESFMAYRLDATGMVRDIQSGNKCASGTGEFFLQQLGRMGLSLEDIGQMDAAAQPYTVSGRCSVFCKSDCTHALNKGALKQSVVAGLGLMMASKCLELLRSLPEGPVLLVGGCAANPYLVRFLREQLSELIVPGCAPWFEALGAALWALEHAPGAAGGDPVLIPREHNFTLRPPLYEFHHMVDFKTHPRANAQSGDDVLVGLDVGSTTTKGVVLRRGDSAVLAGEYLRTEGDPIAASRRVYASLAGQLGNSVRVTGLGVTGSGRAIAALHASATAAINEIVAHAAAAAHYDPKVDTIFEIGGQDAKYTFLSRGHPCDTAMNEACSAGTGSFLEESARESLGVATEEIAARALQASSTPNFNDQCSAFIGSDIKLAVQEGLPVNDILAGLVHSVCLNYVSRVKGSRPAGDRIFMQGGVCYNEAVPVAMAMLTGKRIVVPPEPGLMGALGVALEVERRQRHGVLPHGSFDLRELARREAGMRPSFTCRGGKGGQNGCDRRCAIARVEIAGKIHPFGGICNRFENLRRGATPDSASLDLVHARQNAVFSGYEPPHSGRPVVGLSRSYLVNTYFPLFSTFFKELGFQVVLPGKADSAGMLRKSSALCYPAELSHGFMAELLAHKPDALFLPHVRALPARGGQKTSCTCVLLQGEPFYLRAAFPELSCECPRLLSPTLDFTRGLGGSQGPFLHAAKTLGASESAARKAYQAGVEAQNACRETLKRLGRDALERLEASAGEFGVVLFGRSYNAFAAEANKAVPGKLATRGALVIPCDMLPLASRGLDDFPMYWSQGRTILAAARFTAAHPKLFGVYVTNFSCGPDSFLLGYFRDEMRAKPSLTLELDSHTADAGLETRIEAFLDIANNHRRLGSPGDHSPGRRFTAAKLETKAGRTGIVTSAGEWLPLFHKRVRLALPSMNPYGTGLAAAALAAIGVRAVALPPADEDDLTLGRNHSTCKECLPLQLTVGTLLSHLHLRPKGEVTAYFMPSAEGPCRFGQYREFTSRLIGKLRLPDTVVLSPSADNGYAGLSSKVTLAIWRGIVAGDFFEEMRSMLLVAARDPEQAVSELDDAYCKVESAMRRSWKSGLAQMQSSALDLTRIARKADPRTVPKVALVGEIYVRHDPISRQKLIERLAAKGIAVRTSPVSEWIFYTDWLQNAGVTDKAGLRTRLKQWFKRLNHMQVKKAFQPSGLIESKNTDIAELVRAGASFVSPRLTGEAILTVGAAFHEILAPACGVVAIGPFGCMPTRLAEAILTSVFDTDTLDGLYPERLRRLDASAHGKLPFLTVETDGNPFPQLIEARLEAFCLQALRTHAALNL